MDYLQEFTICQAWLPALIGAVGALGSSIAGGVLNKRAADKTNDFQREMYYDQQKYNTPSEQMKRFKLAGLNPNLIYTQSNVNNQAIPAAVTPNYDSAAAGAMSAFQGFQGALNQGVENDLLKGQVENQIISNRMALLDERMKNIDVNWYEVEKKTNNELLRQQIRQTKSTIRKLNYEFKNILPAQYDLLKKQSGLTDEQKTQLFFQRALENARIKIELQRLGITKAQLDNSQWVLNIARGFMQSYGIQDFTQLGKLIGKLTNSFIEFISRFITGS